MTIKTLLFCIFLYVCLVWVGAAYLFSGDAARLRETGLLWTGAGLLFVLVIVLSARIWGWWRVWRAKVAARPRTAAAGRPAPTVHEDDAALAGLIAEANEALAKAPGYRPRAGHSPLSHLPLYLLVGPEGSGKTSIMLNSGLEAQLLAGQTAGSSAPAPTRLCNLWLAKNAIFVELSGRLFSGDSERWVHLLGMLRGNRSLPLWRRLRGDPEEGFTLRGVVAFCDIREFSGASADPQRHERYCRLWRERLSGIAEAFAADFPVYTVITKSETIPYFPEFFRRLPEADASQVLGCTLRRRQAKDGEVFAEAEARRITASFRPLYQALAELRLANLAREPVTAHRPAIYEFPREMKRIRQPLVQFLTDGFRPNRLRPGATLRGYYFTGTREVDAAAGETAVSRPDASGSDLGGTHLFRLSEATEIFRPDDPNRSRGPAAGRSLVRQWMFVTAVFHEIILRDEPVETAPRVDPRMGTYWRGAVGAACGICLLLGFVFFGSWLGNRALLTDVQAAGLGVAQKAQTRPATLAELQSLDEMRRQLKRLREGAGLSLHWGLYSGNEVLGAARSAYFRRFQELLLNDLNGRIVRGLAEAPTIASGEEAYNPLYGALKTHLTISSGVCKLDAPAVTRVLKQSRAAIAPDAGPEWSSLADAQVDFYITEFAYGNPCRIREDAAVRDSARRTLQKLKGIDRIYAAVLAGVEKGLPKPTRLSDLAPNYRQVLSGPAEPGAAFTNEGWTAVEKGSKDVKGVALGESCVMGDGGAGEWRQDAAMERGVQHRFLREYVQAWRNYIGGFSVNRFAGADDAAKKLDLLAANNSPLLALLALTANQTSFRAPVEGGIAGAAKKLPVFGDLLKGGEKAAAKVAGVNAETSDGLSRPADIAHFFQAVHAVVAPQSQTWITEKNKPYIEAVADLGRSMREIASGGSNIDPAVHQAANQNADKAQNAAAQISRSFNPVGVEGLDQIVRNLLERPIQLARPFIKTDLEAANAEKVNGQLKGVCMSVAPVLVKFPFNPASKEDARIDEFNGAFGPNGAVLKFAQSLGEAVVKEGAQWKAKDPAKKPQVRQDLLNFLNAAQRVADALYPAGATQPQLRYTLRPRLEGFGDTKLELEIDGAPHEWTIPVQHDFTWPPATGVKEPGAIARLRFGNTGSAFLAEMGVWAIFRIMGYAEPRDPTEKLVVWKYSRVGRLDPIRPGPVQVELVNGAQVLNPKFFDGLQHCPAKGVQ